MTAGGRFLFADEVIDADCAVVGPRPALAAAVTACVVRRRRRRPRQASVRWVTDDSGEVDETYRVGRRGNDHVLGFGDYAVTLISRDGATIDYWVGRGVDDGYVAHLLLDHVLPMRLGVLRRTALHGTAVALDAGAVAFVGPTGAGKSTMAASFAANGHPLLADDCLLLDVRADRHWVIPTYPGARLTEDSHEALVGTEPDATVMSDLYPKHLVGAATPGLEFSDQPLPLLAIVFVVPSESGTVGLRRIPALEAFRRLLDQTWYTEAVGAELSGLVDRVGAVINGVRTLELERTDDFADLEHCRKLVLDRLNDRHETGASEPERR